MPTYNFPMTGKLYMITKKYFKRVLIFGEIALTSLEKIHRMVLLLVSYYVICVTKYCKQGNTAHYNFVHLLL